MHGPMASKSNTGVVMSVTRLLFLAEYRVPHACFSLQWDHMLEGIDETVVACTSNLDKKQIDRIFRKYNIDTSRFTYMDDSVIYEKYPQVNNWVFPGDYRTYWLRQQAIKLSYIDLLDRDVMMIQDPDTFMIKPYCPYHDNKLVLMSLMNTTQGSYDGMFESITGIPRPTPHCFVTEFVPVRKKDWQDLKLLLSQRWPGKYWLDAIIDAVPGMPTIPPWGDGNLIKWFAEPELLGDWAVVCGNVDYYAQLRFEYDSLTKLHLLDPSVYNAVCDAIPDLRLSMQFDWQREEVIDFDRYLSIVKTRIDDK